MTASATAMLESKYQTIHSSGGDFQKSSGVVDRDGSPVDYKVQTGNMPIAQDKQDSRSFSVVYRPTSGDSDLTVGMHYNNSPSPRANAIASDRGSGFVSSAGTLSTLNMNAARSPLGDASGLATAYFSGRAAPRSAGSDRHVAVAMSGAQAGTTGNAVVLHRIDIDGVG